MQIRVSKLREKLSLLQPVVPRKPTLAILSSVLIKDGTITATDLEARVSVGLGEANGSCWLLPYKPVMDFLKYVPGDEMLTIDPNGDGDKKLQFSWEDGSASFETKEPSEYPVVELKDPGASGIVDGDILVAALSAAVKYCATTSERATLTGVTLYPGNVLQVAAADGFRMSFQSLNLKYLDPVNKHLIIPATTVAILEELWKREPSQVGLANDLISQIMARRQLELSIYNNENYSTMEVKFGNVTLISRLISGNPPDYLALLNNFKEPIKTVLLGPDLFNAVRRVGSVAKGGAGIVRLQWDETKMTVSAADSDGAEVSAKIPVQAGGTPGRIAINVSYLLNYLADKTGMVIMGKSEEPNAPSLFHYGNRPIVALMPMQVKWGDEEPATGEENPQASADETNGVKPEIQNGAGEPDTVGAGVGGPTEKEEKPKRRGRKKK